MDIEKFRAVKRSAAPVASFELAGLTYLLRPAYPADPELRAGDAAFFCRLRAASAEWFFDRSTPDEAGVARWVAQVYDADDGQINFLATDSAGGRLGFLGLYSIDRHARCAEIGRLMRERHAPPRLIAAAGRATLGWAGSELALERVRAEAIEHNRRGLRLWARVGIVEVGRHRRLLGERGNAEGCSPLEQIVVEGVADLTNWPPPRWPRERR